MGKGTKKSYNNIKSMRLSDEVISYVNKVAEEENRSFSNAVETILRSNMKESINM